jgi:hypothetical protein
MKQIITIVIAIVGMLVLVGCANLSTSVFNAEKATTETIYGAVHAFNQYYHVATNGVGTNKLAELNARKDFVYKQSAAFARTVKVSEALRKQYVANSADTNKTALLIALQSMNAEATNIVSLVKMFLTTN